MTWMIIHPEEIEDHWSRHKPETSITLYLD